MRETPYRVNLEELPADWQRAAQQALPAGMLPHTLVMIPQHTQSLQKRRRFVPPQALGFTETGVVLVQSAPETSAPPEAFYINSADIVMLRHSLILLYGCLELQGSMNGVPVRMMVEYNTVGELLLHAALQQVLRQAYGPAAGNTAPKFAAETASQLQALEAQSFKFRNGLSLYALLPEERLLGYVWQPRLMRPVLRIFRRAFAPAALLAVTPQAVIAIEEERIKGAAYGWLITFCPRRRILAIDTQPLHTAQRVTVRLAGAGLALSHTAALDQARAAAWGALWDSCNEEIRAEVNA